MTSLHRLIAIIVIWGTVACAAFSLFGTQFLHPLPAPTLIILAGTVFGGAAMATGAIVWSRDL